MNLQGAKNKTKYFSLFLLFAVIFILIPHQAHALIAGDIVAIFSAMGEQLNDVGNPLMKWIFDFFIWYIAAFFSLYISATLLTFVISHPEWLDLANSPVANSGWNFVAGVANVFLVLILLVVAFTYILRIETFQAKKSLPRLIIAALLINFSFVFVKMVVDISTVLYNTVLQAAGVTAGGETTLVYDVLNTMGFNLNRVIEGFIFLFSGLAIKAMIPFLSPFFELALILGVLTLVFLPNILLYSVQIALSFLLSAVFFTFTFLFAARIFVIQILAALAPLAFVCYVLPQTKKHWDEWLNHLLEWSFLGVFLFFFLVLGLKAGVGLQPATPLVAPPIAAPFFGMGGALQQYFVYYFFLFIYCALILYLTSKAMPAIAGFILGQAAAVGAVMYTQGLKPLGISAKRQVDEAAIAQQKIEAEAKSAGRSLTLRERGSGVIAKGVNWTYRRLGTSTEQEFTKQKEARAKKFEKMSKESLYATVDDRLTSENDLATAFEALAKKSKLRDQDLQKCIDLATKGKLDSGEILKARPDWAEDAQGNRRTVFSDRGITGEIERQKPKEFREKVQTEALRDVRTVTSLDRAKIEDVGRYGSREQKAAIRETVRLNAVPLTAEIQTLLGSPNRADQERGQKLMDNLVYIADNYNV